MHPPLHRPHPTCQHVVDALELCHTTNPYAKFYGVCSDAKVLLDDCFRVEKEMVRALNAKKAMEGVEGGGFGWQKSWERELERKEEEELKKTMMDLHFLSTTMTSSGFASWPTNRVECDGDYRKEQYLEALIGGNLYKKQSALPSLPVPTLKQTLSTFLSSALALCETKEEASTLTLAVKNFESEGGTSLNSMLMQRANDFKGSSWLQLWWNQLGYLSVRDPLVINVSYFFQFKDDYTCITGISRGAAMLVSSAIFRKTVCSGSMECESVGRGSIPLCSTAYKYMFNACRVPRNCDTSNGDTYNIYDPSVNHHVVVARNGYFFEFDFVDSATGDPLPVAILESHLASCIAIADSGTLKAPCIGVLTSQDRDAWADDRDKLVALPGIEAALSRIESGALLLCLDASTPVDRASSSSIFWHGGPTGQNRFFDKSIQLIVTDNGKAGLLGEHSMMDGMPVVKYADYIVGVTYEKARQLAPLPADYGNYSMPSSIVKPIFNAVDSATLTSGYNGASIAHSIANASASYTDLISTQELKVLTFHGYGAGFIKQTKVSPDAYVQMAIQLATFRLFGKNVATYEASQVRPFKHGRTETTRSCSIESVDFCKAMGARPALHVSGEEVKGKVEKFRKAASQHVKYLNMAGSGNGCDRHLFGLKMLTSSLPHGTAQPSLFDHPLLSRSKTWKVSTSHLTHPQFDNWGWGEVVPDGVGLAYSIHPEKCVVNVTARVDQGLVKPLVHYIEEALVEIREMVLVDAKGGKSKL